MVAKTVYDTYWKPSPITALVFLAMAGTTMYLPYYLHVPVIIQPWVALIVQVAFTIGVTIFFYSGIAPAKQCKVAALMFLALSVFGVISNIFYQATVIVSAKMLTTDYVVVAIINFAAVALTMSCYRISRKKIEVSAEEEANELNPEKRAQNAPLVYALPVVAAVTLMYFSQSLPNGASFPISLNFFAGAQLLISFWSAHFFFKDKTRAEKNRLGLSILAITMILGAVGNLLHHLTEFRAGYRIMLNSSEFLIMNVGAVVIVLVFVNWNKSIAEQRAKRAKLLESSLPPESVTIPPEKVAAAAASTDEGVKLEKPQDKKTV